MMPKLIKKLFVFGVSHTYSNLSRLFLRMFVGVMLMQFCIRHVVKYEYINAVVNDSFISMGAMALLVMGVICSVLIILGFLTRIAILPPLATMITMTCLLMGNSEGAMAKREMLGIQTEMLPVLFIGIFVFIILAGPGKISLDYVISRYFVSLDKEPEPADDEALEEA